MIVEIEEASELLAYLGQLRDEMDANLAIWGALSELCANLGQPSEREGEPTIYY